MQVFFIDILAACIFMIASGLVVLLAWKTNWWVLAACIPIALYLQIISSCARMLYVVEKKTFKAAIKEAFHLGHQKFGGYFIIFILTYIPLGITSLIAFLPICIFHLSNSADAITRLMGDPSGLPPYLLPLYAVLAILAIFIWGQLTPSNNGHWHSIHISTRTRTKYKAEYGPAQHKMAKQYMKKDNPNGSSTSSGLSFFFFHSLN